MTVQSLALGPLATNCYIVTDEKTERCAVIDPGFASKQLLKALEGMQVDMILLTHAHIDHIMGVHAVQEMTGAKLYVHENEAERLQNPDANLYNQMGCYNEPFLPLAADQFVADGDTLELGQTKIKVISTPGHTHGSVCYLAEKTLFSGDTLFCGSYGRVDFPTGSFSSMVDSFYRLTQLEGDYLVLPGHQETTTLQNERLMNPLARYI